ncbi:Cobalt-zinc-cadmium resistance protein CzcB [Planctomycetes bacterium CA13]|uniref:Cobalt-zinc-cadmium resistance protein CzcB n=1 Tax=Novipirellula herctigrandis TaxID=2527986 RepID=A0A5C5ZA02_9BACT|nr:Cobalt-zinc-cadmium resistance protein CzcB [Planctomycetes bacterium CA13]
MSKKLVYAVSLCAVIVAGGWLFWALLPDEPVITATQSTASTELQTEINTVRLTPENRVSVGIVVETAKVHSLVPTRTLPGRLDYDQDLHVAIKSACDGIVTEVMAHPGTMVSRGQVVATIVSPEVGQARSLVQSRLADQSLAESARDRDHAICLGVQRLVEMIREGKTPDQIEEELADESLGVYRRTLISAYTRERLAKEVAKSSREAASRGALAGRIQSERENEQQAAEASLASLADSSLFEVHQKCKQSEAAFAAAKREVKISLQRLNALLGPAAPHATETTFDTGQSDTISNVDLVSPIDGTVEERLLTATERVIAGDSIFTIADTDRLWAVADVRERDWSAITVSTGQRVKVTLPAMEEAAFDAEIIIVGRRVDPATGAAPLVAALQSSDTRLRPGLFLRMKVPTGPPTDVIAVPEQAVVVHENESFVFVAEGEDTFRRVNVSTGRSEDGYTEIECGIDEGDPVVVAGVFKLKSELLLAGEGE